jgi:predicted CxxxxCH...CXXCH cytochrome family protein
VDSAVTVTGYTGADPALLAAVKDPGYARSGAGASCAASYCHGATLEGGSLTAPSWTVTNGTQAACGTCHGRPPLTGPDVAGYPAHKFHTYRQRLACGTCHEGASQTALGPAAVPLHVNGVKDVRVPHLACVPAGCDPAVDVPCACTAEVATIEGWDCARCHGLFNSAY